MLLTRAPLQLQAGHGSDSEGALSSLLTAAGSASALCDREGRVIAMGRGLEYEINALSAEQGRQWFACIRNRVLAGPSGGWEHMDRVPLWPTRLVPVATPSHGWVLVRVQLPRRSSLPESIRSALTRREAEVATHIVDGLRSRAIAVALRISVHTVRRITERIYFKVGVHGRTELTRRALGADVESTGLSGAARSA